MAQLKYWLTMPLMAVAAIAATSAAQAQNRTVNMSRVGPFLIDQILENGRFDRCAATLSPGPNMLRIAFNRRQIYAISVPGVPVPANAMVVYLGRGQQTLKPQTDPARVRAWSEVNLDTMAAFMGVTGTIAIDLGSKKYRWPIGQTRMEDVLRAVESCTQKALGNY